METGMSRVENEHQDFKVPENFEVPRQMNFAGMPVELVGSYKF